MESKNKYVGVKEMANISNPDFLNYLKNTSSRSDFSHLTETSKGLGGALSMRIDKELQHRLKRASKITGISQRVISTNAIELYLEYIEKELGIDLSNGFEGR